MSLRWKYMLVLLLFSLVPMLFLTTVSRIGTERLGGELTLETRAVLTEDISQDLRIAAQGSAMNLNRQIQVLHLGINLIGRAAETALVAESLPSFTRPILTSQELARNPEKFDLAPAEQYTRGPDMISSRTIPITFHSMVFHLPPGVRQDSRIRDSMHRINSLLASLKTIAADIGDTAIWTTIALPNGAVAVYPASAGIPRNYDARRTEWYKMAMESGEADWYGPQHDPLTGQIVSTLSRSIRSPEGNFLGVVSMSVPLARLMRENTLTMETLPSMETFIVVKDTDPDAPDLPLYRLISRAKRKDSGGWVEEPVERPFAQEMNAKFNGIHLQDAGFFLAPLNGRSAAWGYSRFGKRAIYALAIPLSEIHGLVSSVTSGFDDLVRKQLQSTAIVVGMTLIAIALFTYFASQRFTRPMRDLARANRRLASGDFTVRLKVVSNDERAEVATAFNNMVPRLEEQVRMKSGLELASRIQHNLLPPEPPPIPGYDVAGKSLFCDETGGDYYDYFIRDNGRKIALAIGDISGHGVASALLMTTARALLRSGVATDDHPAEIVRKMNKLLTPDIYSSGSFMTLLFIEFDVADKSMVWVRAGHDPCFFYRPSTGRITELKGEGVAIGLQHKTRFHEYHHDFEEPGAILVLGTDGIWEAYSQSGELFGKRRLFRVLRRNAGRSSREIMEAILQEVEEFREGALQQDDITLAVIKRNATES